MTGNDGTHLEAAAEAIERLLLEHRAELEGQEIVVTPRKREVVNGALANKPWKAFAKHYPDHVIHSMFEIVQTLDPVTTESEKRTMP